MMAASEPFRLRHGGLIDRDKTLSFSFDGRRYTGRPGDTLASALLANGVHLVGRSFKYHRPRGIFGAGSEDPNALMELRKGARREPNTLATTTELHDGLEARSQNRFPSLRFDIQSVNSLLSPFLAAGFYYKTFMWPASFWEKLYEPLIRRSAGLGRAALEPDPDHYEKAFAHCDLLVIGGGPAGLMAALTAGRAHPLVLRALKLARHRRARTLSITDATLSDVTEHSELLLYYSSNGPSYIRSNAALMGLVQALAHGVYSRDEAAHRDRIRAFKLK